MRRANTTLITIALTAFYACYVSVVFADNTNDIIRREMLRREKIVKEVTKQNDNFEKYKNKSEQKIQGYRELISSIKEQHVKNAQAKGHIKPAPQVVVFVSFSMPALSLKQIIQDASRYQIPVVVRGLYENSFRKTIEKIFDLVKENNKGGILINPNWFKGYDIKAVPAVVVTDRVNGNKESKVDKRTYNKEINKSDVVYGNIPLKRALTIIAEQGSMADVAKNVLSRGGA